MSRFDQRESGPRQEAASQTSATTPTNKDKDNRPSQYDRVLSVLLEHGEVCGHHTFYASMMIPRFGAHLNRMKNRGILWSKRPCDRHNHEGTAYLYRLESVPAPAEGEPCPACGGRLACVSDCRARSLDMGTLPFVEGSA